MPQTITLTANDGSTVQYVDNGDPMQGGLKDVYFSPDRSYVVAFFREKFSPAEYSAQKDRLTTICGKYRDNIFNKEGGSYWADLYCWPSKVVEYKGLLGVVAPVYQPDFSSRSGTMPPPLPSPALWVKRRKASGLPRPITKTASLAPARAWSTG